MRATPTVSAFPELLADFDSKASLLARGACIE